MGRLFKILTMLFFLSAIQISISGQTIYSNDFSSTSLAEWTHHSYTTGLHGPVIPPAVVNGRLEIYTRDQQVSYLETGNESWSNYTLEYDVKIKSCYDDCGRGIYTFFYVTNFGGANGVNAEAYFLRIHRGTIQLWRSRAEGTGIQYTNGSLSYSIGVDYHIKIIVDGARVIVYFNEVGASENLVIDYTITDGLMDGGGIAFGGGDDIVSIDNIVVSGGSVAPDETLLVNVPNGGEIYLAGEQENIKWTSSGIDFVDIDYTIDGSKTWRTVADGVNANLGEYTWTIPTENTTKGKVRITSSADETIRDESDGKFSINTNTEYTKDIFEFLSRMYSETLPPAPIKENKVQSLYEDMKYDYEENKKKHIGFISVSLPIVDLVGGGFYVDLDDYAGISTEGSSQDQWVTVWLNYDFSAGISIFPGDMGVFAVDYKEPLHDPARSFDFSLPEVAVGVKVKPLVFTDDGIAINMDPNLISESFTINPSASIGSASWNMLRFEIKKDALNALIYEVVTASLTDGALVKIGVDILLDTFFRFDRFFKPRLIILPSSYRWFTPSDEGPIQSVDGVINYARGGIDIDEDGIMDNYFPKSLEDMDCESCYGNAWKLFIDWTNIGYETEDFYIEPIEQPAGWNIGSMKNTFPFFTNNYKSKDVKAGETIVTEWLINYDEGANDEVNVLFGLYRDNLFWDDPLDSIEIALNKYTNSIMSVNGLSPIELEVTAPSGKVIDKNIDENNFIYQEYDIDNSGDTDSQVLIALPENGDYEIVVKAKDYALPDDYYSIEVVFNETANLLVDSSTIKDIPSTPITFNVNTTGIEDEESMPQKNYLYQNYPNPFNPSTTVNFSLNKNEHVLLEVYNSLGQKLNTLVNEVRVAGSYSVQFNGNNLPSGIYFLRLRAGQYLDTKKMILLK